MGWKAIPGVRIRKNGGTSTAHRGRLNLIEGSGATITVVDDAGSDEVDITIEASGAGGGGKSYITDPNLLPPASPHADDDEFNAANGTDPTSGSWAWGNQASHAAVERHGRLNLQGPAGASAWAATCLLKAVPAGGWDDINTRVTMPAWTSPQGAGLVLLWGTVATPTALRAFKAGYITGPTLRADTVTGYTAGSATLIGTARFWAAHSMYQRIEWDTTTLTFKYSYTGGVDDWVTYGTNNPGSAPDFMGVFVEAGSAATKNALFDFFRVNWTPTFDPNSDD